jgi:hypothetical protein
MNASAEQHLAKAKDYIGKGDEFYRKARPEILAARKNGANTSEIARYLAHSRTWVDDILAWDGKGTLYGDDTKRRQIRQAKQVLRESPDVVAALTPRELDLVAEAVHAAQMQNVRAGAAKTNQTLSDDSYGDLTQQIDDVHAQSTLEMAELFASLSRVRVKGIEGLVGNATARERRDWAERLPEEIALLQLALDLCKTRKLEAVNG